MTIPKSKSLHWLEKLGNHDEPDGTEMRYAIEAKYGLAQGEDWLAEKWRRERYKRERDAEYRQQELNRNMVMREVYLCQSHLVEMLFSKEIVGIDAIENFYIYKDDYDLRYEFRDHADEWDSMDEDEKSLFDNSFPVFLEDHKGLCDDDIYCYQEIFEWWAVSSFLEERLREHNQPFLVTNYGTWWGRCCTGQAIYIDPYIRDIQRACGYGGRNEFLENLD